MRIAGLIVLLIAGALSGCATRFSSPEPQFHLQAEPNQTIPSIGHFSQNGTISEIQLQQELQAFADQYVQRIMQAVNDALQAESSSSERAALDLFKSTSASSAISIATSHNPLHGLRDMQVLVRLQELVWRNGNPFGVSDAHVKAIHRQLVHLDRRIHMLTQRVVPAVAMQELDQRIEDWHRENPDHDEVAFIRFQNLDLADSALGHITVSTGLLAPVTEAAREVHETRKLAERALFLANHMPMLMQWRAELLSDRVIAGLSKQGYLEEASKMRATFQQLSKDREAFQQELELYRPLVRQLNENIQIFPQRVSEERIALFNQIDRSFEDYGPALTQIEHLAVAGRDAMLGVERIMQLNNQTEGMTKQEMSNILDKLLLFAKDVNQVVAVVDAMASNKSDVSALSTFNQLLIEHERRVFAYATALLVLIAGLLLGVRWGWLRMNRTV